MSQDIDNSIKIIKKQLDLAKTTTDKPDLKFGLDVANNVLDLLKINIDERDKNHKELLNLIDSKNFDNAVSTVPANNPDIDLSLKKINNNFNILFGLLIIGICLIIFSNLGFNNA